MGIRWTGVECAGVQMPAWTARVSYTETAVWMDVESVADAASWICVGCATGTTAAAVVTTDATLST